MILTFLVARLWGKRTADVFCWALSHTEPADQLNIVKLVEMNISKLPSAFQDHFISKKSTILSQLFYSSYEKISKLLSTKVRHTRLGSERPTSRWPDSFAVRTGLYNHDVFDQKLDGHQSIQNGWKSKKYRSSHLKSFYIYINDGSLINQVGCFLFSVGFVCVCFVGRCHGCQEEAGHPAGRSF